RAGEPAPPCSYCHGQGVLRINQGFFSSSQPCPNCKGWGSIVKNPCTQCRGERIVNTQAKLAVTIPAGVQNNQRLKLREEGDVGPHGGAPGDLFVVVTIKEHPLFKRQNDDIYLDLPLSFVDASLGTMVQVPTLTGFIELKIPSGTSSGKLFRLRGKGFPHLGSHDKGDMFIRVAIDVPPNLSKAQQDLLQELKKVSQDSPLVKDYGEKIKSLKNRR
ncbi:MAG: DnaJ C-terminal domain-containing protein, partial [Bdellovibrionia bacterium]